MNAPSKCAVCKKEVDRYNGRMIFDVWHCDECALVARAAPRPTPNQRGNGNGHFEQVAAEPPSEVVQAPAEVGVVTGRQSTRRIPALPPSPTVLPADKDGLGFILGVDDMAGEKSIADYMDDAEVARRLKKIAERDATGGLRSNEGKPRFSLISPWAMEGLARVLTHGAQKYADHNWRKGLSWQETIDSLKRHLAAFERGEELDSESGLPHVDHITCNATFLSEFQKLGRGTDDRWKP